MLLRNTLHSQVLTGQLTTKIVTKVQILNYFWSYATARFDILIASLYSHGLLKLSILSLNITVLPGLQNNCSAVSQAYKFASNCLDRFKSAGAHKEAHLL